MKVRRRKIPATTSPEPPADLFGEEVKRDSIAAFLEHTSSNRPEGSKRGRKVSQIEAAIAEAERRGADGDWETAGGRAFVGLYALCHRLVYGVTPVEIEGPVMIRSSKLAIQCLHNHFKDDRGSFVEFIKWAWEREKRKEAWALRNGITRNRMGVMLQFSGSMVTDHRVETAKVKRYGRR